jgi:hypothetical protein
MWYYVMVPNPNVQNAKVPNVKVPNQQIVELILQGCSF